MTRVDESEQGRFFIDTEIGFRLEDEKTFRESLAKTLEFYQLEQKFIWKTFCDIFSHGMEKLAQSLMKIYRWKCFNYLWTTFACLFIAPTDCECGQIGASSRNFNRARESGKQDFFDWKHSCWVNCFRWLVFILRMASPKWNMSYTKLLTQVKVLILAAFLTAHSHANQIWDHAVYLNDDYLLQWTVKEPDILFEVQVKAHGYVGFGFSRDGTTIYGADVFIGWIDEGHIFFYVSISNIIRANILRLLRNKLNK